MKFSHDAAIPRIPAPHLLKQGQLQLAGASFREQTMSVLLVCVVVFPYFAILHHLHNLHILVKLQISGRMTPQEILE